MKFEFSVKLIWNSISNHRSNITKLSSFRLNIRILKLKNAFYHTSNSAYHKKPEKSSLHRFRAHLSNRFFWYFSHPLLSTEKWKKKNLKAEKLTEMSMKYFFSRLLNEFMWIKHKQRRLKNISRQTASNIAFRNCLALKFPHIWVWQRRCINWSRSDGSRWCCAYKYSRYASELIERRKNER